jgi:hypothetical protein
MAVQTQIQTRRGDAATWTSTNPTLADGEIGFESDTNKFKIGTGSTAWASLPYASNVSPLTTKGDLYTYSTDNDRLAVGANGETLVADSSASTGLRYQATNAAGKNAIINGGFDIAQRGTSFTVASIAYTVDRWQIWSTGAGGNCVVTRVAGTGDAQFAAEFGRQSGSTDLTVPRFAQTIETANSVQYAGKNIVVSFEGLEGANYSGGDLTVDVITGTGTNQNFTAFTGSATVSTNFALTGTNATYSTAAIAIPAGTKEIALVFRYTATGTAGAADYVRLQKVQFEIGSVATAFTRAGGTIQGELAACQRYYYRQNADANYSQFGSGSGHTGGTITYIWVRPPVQMRVSPGTLDYGNIAAYDNASVTAITSAVIDNNLSSRNGVQITCSSASGITQYRPYTLVANNTSSGFIGLGAEL